MFINCSADASKSDCSGLLSGLHAHSAIDANAFAIDVVVFNQALRQVSDLVGKANSPGVEHLAGEGFQRSLDFRRNFLTTSQQQWSGYPDPGVSY